MVNVFSWDSQEAKLGLVMTMVYAPFGRDRSMLSPAEKVAVCASAPDTVAVKSWAGLSTEGVQYLIWS